MAKQGRGDAGARPRTRVAPPTMIDVATLAGVGLGTVSRVVNGSPAVRAETARRVQAAIDELGFQRNEIARALRPGKNSASLALLLGDLTNPFYATVAKAAVEVAKEAGFAVVLGSVDEDPAGERRAIRELVGRQVAGLMIVPDQGDHSFLADPGMPDLPVVFVDRPATNVAADVVLLDNDRGAMVATDHLLSHGHRRIAMLMAPSYYATGQRLRGYRRALRLAGIPVDESLVVALPQGTTEAAEQATHHLLARPDPPTAIFASTSFLSEGVLRGCRGFDVAPALVGFDDFRFADLLATPVTVVAGDIHELGRRAARLLLGRIGGDTGPARRVVIPVTLVPRGSGEHPPASA